MQTVEAADRVVTALADPTRRVLEHCETLWRSRIGRLAERIEQAEEVDA